MWEESRTGEQSLALAQLHTCPVCLGRDLCTELNQQFLTVSMFGEEGWGGQAGTLYQAALNDEEELGVFSPAADSWDAWDLAVCKNSSQWRGCLVSQAASKSFLYKARGDATQLRTLHKFSGEAGPAALTACATPGLASKLRDTFDADRDYTVTLEEKAMLFTAVGAAPATAMQRLAPGLGLTAVPRYVGSCGRLTVQEGQLTALSEYLDRPWETRAELAGQLLSLLDTLHNRLEDWLLFAWDLDWDSFAVSRTGQVILAGGLARTTPVEKTILATAPTQERPVCNEKCFAQFRSDVFMATPHGTPGRGCGVALLHADLMHAELCRFVLADSEAGRGLLHSGPARVAQLLADCTTETAPGRRWQAVDHLTDFLDDEISQTTTAVDAGEDEDGDATASNESQGSLTENSRDNNKN